MLQPWGPRRRAPEAYATTPTAIKTKNGPVYRQWVRLQRRAFARQAVPIHRSAAVQTTARASGLSKPARTIAAPGRPQNRPKERQLPAQSCLATAGRICTGRARLLDRRTGHVSVGAEDAAIAPEWPQHRAAVVAVVEILAGVGRHRFGALTAAFGASDCTLKLRHKSWTGRGGQRRARRRQ